MPKPDATRTFNVDVRQYMYPHHGYWDAIRMMGSRMCMSEPKYGDIDKVYPDGGNALKGLEDRLALYRETGNTEWLLDVANMAIIEHLRPAHPQAHFRATSSEESPGFPKWEA